MRHDIGKNKDVAFLFWLKNRLKNKYGEDQSVVNQLDSIINTKKIVDNTIDIKMIEHICAKFWPDFNNSNSEYFSGISEMSESEKDTVRSLVLKILMESRKGLV